MAAVGYSAAAVRASILADQRTPGAIASGVAAPTSSNTYGLTGKQIAQGIRNPESQPSNQSPTPSTSFKAPSTGGVGTPAPIPVRTSVSPSSSGGLPSQLNTGYPGLYVVSNNAPFAEGGIHDVNYGVPKATPVYALTQQNQKVQLTTGEGYTQASGGYKFVTPDSPNYGRVSESIAASPTGTISQQTYSRSQPNPNSTFDAPLVSNRPQTVRQQQVNEVFNSVQAGASLVDRGAPSSMLFSPPGTYKAPMEKGTSTPFAGGLFGFGSKSTQPPTENKQAGPTNNSTDQFAKTKTVQNAPSGFGKAVDFFNPFGSSRKELVQKDIQRIENKQQELEKRGTILAGVQKGLLNVPLFAEKNPKTFLATGVGLGVAAIVAPPLATVGLAGLGIYNVGKQVVTDIPIFKSGNIGQKNVAKGELATTVALSALPFIGKIPQIGRNIIRSETIPIEKITTPEVASGKADFVNVGQKGIKASNPNQLINVFEQSKYAKNIGETKGGFSASPTPLSGSVEVVKGKYVNVPGLAKQRDTFGTTQLKGGEPKAGELPGVFVAPAASTYFLKTSEEAATFSIFPKSNNPTIQFIRAKEVLPINEKTTREPGNIYLTPGVTNYLTKSKVPGKYGVSIRKPEAEGQFAPGTEIKFQRLAGYTKVGKDIVPIKVYDIQPTKNTFIGKTNAAVRNYAFEKEFKSSSSGSKNNFAVSSLLSGSSSLSSSSSIGSLSNKVSSIKSSKGSSSMGSSIRSIGSSGFGSSIRSIGSSGFGSSGFSGSSGIGSSGGGGNFNGASPDKGQQPFISRTRGTKYVGSVLAGITGATVRRTPGKQLTGLEERPFVIPGTRKQKGLKGIILAALPKLKIKVR